MDYNLLKQLINLLEDFQAENSSNKVTDFVVWVNNTLFSGNNEHEPSGHDELLIAFKVMYLNKELKKKAKAILAKSKVSSIDEYSFLLHLNHQHSFRKMEIIELHNLEAPTGIEIIKRLLKNDLIAEFADEEDRRAKRITITKKGARELESIGPRITEIFSRFTENLSLNEKIQISGTLDKLMGRMK